MREIKFRAWDKEDKRWIPIGKEEWKTDLDEYPYLVGELVYDGETKNGRDVVGFKNGKTTFVTFEGRLVDVYPYGGKTDKTYIRDISKRFILMQYTGLKDKNGKEIYEGDIFTCEIGGTKQIYPIEVIDLRDFYEKLDTVDSYMRVNENSIEVIGNIYENPELLKENDKEKL